MKLRKPWSAPILPLTRMEYRLIQKKPAVTSGIRLGSPAGTTRGFGEKEFRQIADWIVEVVDGLAANGENGNAAVEEKVKAEVTAMCADFPLY